MSHVRHPHSHPAGSAIVQYKLVAHTYNYLMYDLRHAGYEPYHTMGVSELCLSMCTVLVLSERTVNTNCFWSYTTVHCEFIMFTFCVIFGDNFWVYMMRPSTSIF